MADSNFDAFQMCASLHEQACKALAAIEIFGWRYSLDIGGDEGAVDVTEELARRERDMIARLEAVLAILQCNRG